MTNPAAYATSLLYSTPWVTPFLPSMVNYPFPLAPGYFPHTQNPSIRCPECSETFPSLQELTNHIKATSHFMQNVPSHPSPPLQHESANNSQASDSPRPSYVSSSNEGADDGKVGGFDFIKSLESTIQSAISKVKGSPQVDKTSPNNFSPFTSSLNPPRQVNGVESLNGKRLTDIKPPPKSSESPLDLTVKRDERHPVAYTGSVPNRDPIRSLKENMKSIFSLMNKSPSKKTDYKPLLQDKLPSNPLEEMLRIVKNTTSDVARKRSSADADVAVKSKKLKSLDLVVPGSSPVVNPIQQMQELVDKKLSTPKTFPETSSPVASRNTFVTSSSLLTTCSPVTSLNAFVTSSRFLPHSPPTRSRIINGSDDDTTNGVTSHTSDVRDDVKNTGTSFVELWRFM